MYKICTNKATKLENWNKTIVQNNIYTCQGIKRLPLLHIKSQKPWLKKTVYRWKFD